MGLLTTASSENRIIKSGLTITYSVNPVEGEWVYQSTFAELQYLYQAWQYHRYATMQYKYLGMSQSAAVSVANNIRTRLTRAFYRSKWDSSSGDFVLYTAGVQTQATVEAVKSTGDLYDVVVTISEHDTRTRREANTNPESVFALENARDYLF